LVEGYRLAPVFFHDWMGSSLLYDVISIIEWVRINRKSENAYTRYRSIWISD
jgi:hypothetical protein